MKTTGIDLVEVSRFKKHAKAHREGAGSGASGIASPDAFLRKAFFPSELAYCFAYAEPSAHLAGMFAAKEAASKALGVTDCPWAEIEIRHERSGRPAAYRKGKRLPVSISISHIRTVAAAVAYAG